MQYRIYGLLLLIAAAIMIWYFKPKPDGTLRYSKRFAKYVGELVPLAVVFLIAWAIPLLMFGAPGTSITSSSAQ